MASASVDDASSGQSNDIPRQVAINDLVGQHGQRLSTALFNLLGSEVAEITYAQIVDRFPLSDVDKDTYDGTASAGHPIHRMHKSLRPGVLEKTRRFREELDLTVLKFDAEVCHEYQAAAPGSRAFNTRLIELVAIAVHQIAVLLYNFSTAEKEDEEDERMRTWVAPKDDAVWWYVFPDGVPATLFRHKWYCDYDQYPNGVAEGVGYWAEGRIFGGVVLFDRRQPGSSTDVDPEAVYLHPDRHDVTYRIIKLLDEQKQALIRFLLAEGEPSIACPLPIIGDNNNRYRVDPEEDMHSTGIYRDLWERKPWPDDAWDFRLRDVFDSLNWVTEQDWLDSAGRAMDRKIRIDEEQFEEDDSDT